MRRLESPRRFFEREVLGMIEEKTLERLPEKTGVYIMKSEEGQILYIGKAKNIKERVRQYFIPGRDGRPQVPFLTLKVRSIDTMITSSEKEALILENTLIKREQPKYNVLLRDDKSFAALKVNIGHEWPKVELVRSKGTHKKDGLYFGPYPSAFSARMTLDLIKKIFPLRQCSDNELSSRTRPCILHAMGRCIAPCVSLCTREEYDNLVDRVVHFLKGSDKEIVQELKAEMLRLSEALEFEKAQAVKNILGHIEKTLEEQRVEKIHGKDMDAVGIYREGDEGILVRMLYRQGRLVSSSSLSFSKVAQDDRELIASFLLQSYDDEGAMPREILVPVEIEDTASINDILGAKKGGLCEVVFPKKGDKKAILSIALENAKAKFNQIKDQKELSEKALMEIKEAFHLKSYPKRIECFDISNFQGTAIVGALVAFTDGEKDTSRYRKFKIKLTEEPDDYLSMYEVLTRRFKKAKEENNLPDLILVDGGKGHLNVALKVLKELDIITVDVLALAKEESRHDKGIRAEKVFLPNVKDPVYLKTHSKILFFLQKIRDEAHRFAISFMHQRNAKAMTQSALDAVPGIGPKKKRALIRRFGSVKKIREASDEELAKTTGITRRDIENIRSFLTSNP